MYGHILMFVGIRMKYLLTYKSGVVNFIRSKIYLLFTD